MPQTCLRTNANAAPISRVIYFRLRRKQRARESGGGWGVWRGRGRELPGHQERHSDKKKLTELRESVSAEKGQRDENNDGQPLPSSSETINRKNDPLDILR